MDSTVRVLFLGDASSAVRSVSRLQSGFSNLGRAAGLAGAAVTVGIVGGLAAATKAAIDFDREMRNVNSIAHLGEGRFKALSKQVLSLSKETGQAPKTLAQGLYDIVSSGFKAAEGIKVLRASAKAATAGMTDTATATKAVVAILNAYHLSADKAREVSDVLFQEVNLGVNTFEELAQNIGDTAPQAAALKVPFTEVSAMLATITRHGTSMAEASTQVSRVLTAMVKPTKDLQQEFKHMGFESGQAAVAQLGLSGVIRRLSVDSKGNQQVLASWLGDIRGIRGVINVTGKNIKDYNEVLNQMGGATKGVGATQKAFAEQAKSISFQWSRAKAELAAAAIPVGQLLFPALEKAASGVEHLASSVQQHMPEIKRQYGDLARTASGAARSVGDFARSAEGMSVIAGGAATIGFAKIVTSIGGLIAGLTAINPLLGAAALGVGVLAGGMLYLYLKTHEVSQEFRDALKAVNDLKSATDTQKQSALDLAAAQTNVKQSHLNVRAAIRERNRVEQESGRNSDAARQAALNVVRAYQALQQANLDVARATDRKRDADARAGNAATQYRDKIRELAATHRHVVRSAQDVERQSDDISRAYYRGWNAAGKNASANERLAAGLKSANRELAKKDSVGYARDMEALAKQMQAAGMKTADFAAAAAALAEALGRIPTHKEVSIIVREERRDRHRGGRGSTDASGGYATGGFIPMSAGIPNVDSVPAMLTPGEVVLNREQQEVLGGPQFIASLFGFTGSPGPGFAGGEFAKKIPPKRRRSKRSPHSKPRGRKHSVAAAKSELKAVEKINLAEDDADRSYGQLVRQYDQSQEVFIRTDANGTDYISQPDIDARVAEIDDLIHAREHMLELLDDEKRELKKAIQRLKSAIAQLVRAIAAEKKAIAALNRQINRERKKRKPNQTLIGQWQSQIQGHESNISNYQGTIRDFDSSLDEERLNLNHQLPFDKRDVQLDIGDLQSERKDVTGTTLPPNGAAGGGDDGQGVIDELLRQIGQLNLALGIQGVQGAIIGAFQRGTIHVPETGLALVHAGEQITPAGVPRGGDGGSISDLRVSVELEGDLAGLEQFIKVKAVEAAPAIRQANSRAFDRDRRGGVLR